MNLLFDEEQKLLQNSAREFMEKEIIPLADSYDRKYRPLSLAQSKELLGKIAPLGYINGMVKEKEGGGGLDHLSYAILLEELSRAYGSLALMSFVQHISGSLLVAHEGTAEQKKKYLPSLMSGDLIACYAITEPDVGSGARDIKTQADLSGSYYVINGAKTWITNGTVAELVVLVARTKGKDGKWEFCRFLVDKRESPYTVRDLPKMGFCSCPTAEMAFDACKMPANNILGTPGEGYEKTMEIFQLFRSSLAVIAVGLSQASLDASLNYAKERKQFGKPIGKFQLIQNMLVDMAIETQASRLLTYQAFQMVESGARPIQSVSMAKTYAIESAIRVTSRGMQVHGAYGMSEEFPLERFFRDARALTIPDGTTEIQRLLVGRELLGMSAFV